MFSDEIEAFYLKCCKCEAKFGEKIIIEHKLPAEEGGKAIKYEVWGASEDPSTWWEKNITGDKTRARKLNRKVIENDEDEVS